MIRIRRVDGVAQAAELNALQREILPYDTPYDTRKGKWWIAVDGQMVVGFAGYVPSARWSDAVYLCRAGVLESHRGQGLQKRLIRVRLRAARAEGMEWAVTDTRDNPPSANSLISQGFRLYDPAKPYGLRGALYWRKKLRSST